MYKVRNASTLGSHCNADVSLQALRQASGAPYYRLSKRTCDEKPSTCKQHKAQTCMNIRLASPAFAEHCALNHSSAANDMCYVTPFTHATIRAHTHTHTHTHTLSTRAAATKKNAFTHGGQIQQMYQSASAASAANLTMTRNKEQFRLQLRIPSFQDDQTHSKCGQSASTQQVQAA